MAAEIHQQSESHPRARNLANQLQRCTNEWEAEKAVRNVGYYRSSYGQVWAGRKCSMIASLVAACVVLAFLVIPAGLSFSSISVAGKIFIAGLTGVICVPIALTLLYVSAKKSLGLFSQYNELKRKPFNTESGYLSDVIKRIKEDCTDTYGSYDTTYYQEHPKWGDAAKCVYDANVLLEYSQGRGFLDIARHISEYASQLPLPEGRGLKGHL